MLRFPDPPTTPPPPPRYQMEFYVLIYYGDSAHDPIKC